MAGPAASSSRSPGWPCQGAKARRGGGEARACARRILVGCGTAAAQRTPLGGQDPRWGARGLARVPAAHLQLLHHRRLLLRRQPLHDGLGRLDLAALLDSDVHQPCSAASHRLVCGRRRGGGGGTWRPEGQEAGVVFTRRRVQRAARRLGSPQSGSCGAVPVGFGTAWLATSAAALWRHSAARHAPRGARPRPGGWLTGHVALGLDPRVGDALALGHAHALDDAALRHSPRKHPAWGAYVGGTQAASKSVRCPHSQPGSACCNVPADRPDIRSACLLPLLALWP